MLNVSITDPLLGGALIGLAASGMLWTNGRIMGVSGILGGLFSLEKNNIMWRVLFILGIFAGSFLIPLLGYSVMEMPFDRGIYAALIGGLLVGVGTTLGNGCTSGHGVCGISRFSPRSFIATLVFIGLGILSVSLMTHFFGGTI